MTSPELVCVQTAPETHDRDEFILSQLTEVHFIARRIHRHLPVFVPIEDLIHSGVLGLLEATEKYDSTKQVQFKTFAQFRIRGAILDSLRELDRVSRRMRSKSRKLVEACEQLLQKLGRQPTEEEIAHEVGLELTGLRRFASMLRSTEITDSHPTMGQDRAETRDLIESAHASPEENPLSQILRLEMREILVEAMASLAEREQQVLSLYYVEQLTMQEIASVLELKSSRVSRIHAAALVKLRQNLQAKEAGERKRNDTTSIPKGVPDRRNHLSDTGSTAAPPL